MDAGDSALHAALEGLASRQVPGVSVAVVRPGGSEFASAGVADIDSGRLASPETAYLWFSMTKIVTATAAMQLAERGALSLDDPVERFVPGFPKPRSAWPAVTVRHLLSHSSGVANPMPVRWVHPAGSPGVSGSELSARLLAKHDRLRSPAGSKAAYSNLGYIALGEVIASASGGTYERYVHEQILDPLGMGATGFSYPAAPGAEVATGYQRRMHPMTPLFRALLPKGIVGSAQGRFLSFNPFLVDGPAYGGLIGPVRDAARFVAVHLNGGELDGVRLLSAQSVEEMQTLQASGRGIDVGLGWFRRGGDRAAGAFWEHLGGGGGYWNMMRIYPDRSVGVLAMGNATRYDHAAVAKAALA